MNNNSLPTIDEILDATYNHGRMADKKLSETKPGDILPWMTHEYAKQQLEKLMLQERKYEAHKLDEEIDNTYVFLTNDLPSLLSKDHDLAVRNQHKDELHTLMAKRISELELLIKGSTK